MYFSPISISPDNLWLWWMTPSVFQLLPKKNNNKQQTKKKTHLRFISSPCVFRISIFIASLLLWSTTIFLVSCLWTWGGDWDHYHLDHLTSVCHCWNHFGLWIGAWLPSFEKWIFGTTSLWVLFVSVSSFCFPVLTCLFFFFFLLLLLLMTIHRKTVAKFYTSYPAMMRISQLRFCSCIWVKDLRWLLSEVCPSGIGAVSRTKDRGRYTHTWVGSFSNN